MINTLNTKGSNSILDFKTINDTLNTKSDNDHTHNYAGSSSASGPATSALACTGNSATATKLANNPTITLSGDASGNVSFNGSSNVTINTTLSNSGVTAGSYGPSSNETASFGGTITIPQITVDAKGRITSSENKNITIPTISDSVELESSSVAASSSAVKTAYDKANEAVTLIGDGKEKLANAITSKGVETTSDDSFDTMATNILSIKGSEAGTGIPPEDVMNLKYVPGKEQVTIFWEDPEDTELTTWAGTKVVYQQGSYPESPSDGICVCDSKNRNQYKYTGIIDNGLIVTGLTNDVTYYFTLFTYSDTGAWKLDKDNVFTVIPIGYRTMTAIIDLSDSNPDTCISYSSSTAMTAKSEEWDEFFGYYPCLLKNGVEVGKLNPNNFTQFEDGTAADITSGDAGDVMIAFPRRGLKIETTDNKIYVSMTDNPNDPDFEYNAHQRGEIYKEKFYVGVYKSYIKNNCLRSISNVTFQEKAILNSHRTYAQNNGSGYEIFAFYQLTYIQSMFILRFKSLNSQTSLGDGIFSSTTTGKNTNSLGMFGAVSNTDIKCFGIENLGGRYNELIDGIYLSDNKILVGNNTFGDISSYKSSGRYSEFISGFMSKPIGTTKAGFLAETCSGSSSTYFCDYANISDYGYIKTSGNTMSNSDQFGIFGMETTMYNIDNSGSYTYTYSTRIMYL